MDIHKNARLTLRSREALAKLVIEQGFTREAAAAAFPVSDKTEGKRVERFRLSGVAGLPDRSSRQMRLKHRRTRPYTPRTNGKAERFIQTALREWAYAKHWTESQERDAHLQPWTDHYNHQRPHGSLDHKPPISRSEKGTAS